LRKAAVSRSHERRRRGTIQTGKNASVKKPLFLTGSREHPRERRKERRGGGGREVVFPGCPP